MPSPRFSESHYPAEESTPIVETTVASVLRDAFIEAIANGDADKDWSAIARVAARKAGLED